MEKLYTTKKSSKKLAAYSALAGAFIVAAGSAEAQVNIVEYTDVDPDESYSGDEAYELDLNNDGTTDFKIQIYTNTTIGVYFPGYGTYSLPGANLLLAIAEDDNAIAASPGPGSDYIYPYAIADGDAINDDLQFYGTSFDQASMIYSLMYSGTQIFSQGEWFGGQSGKSLGLRLSVDGNEHYGWVRLDVADDNQEFTVLDYAYNTIADESIDAGQSEILSVDKIDASKISSYSYGNIIHLNVNNLNPNTSKVSVLNTLGQEIYSDILNPTGMQIEIKGATGLYTLQVVADGAVYANKIFINQN